MVPTLSSQWSQLPRTSSSGRDDTRVCMSFEKCKLHPPRVRLHPVPSSSEVRLLSYSDRDVDTLGPTTRRFLACWRRWRCPGGADGCPSAHSFFVRFVCLLQAHVDLISVWVCGYPWDIHSVQNHLCAEGVDESAAAWEDNRRSPPETASLIWQQKNCLSLPGSWRWLHPERNANTTFMPARDIDVCWTDL